MNARQIARLTLKLLGVYILILGLTFLPDLGLGEDWLWTTGIQTLVFGVLGAWLIASSERLARFLVLEEDGPPTSEAALQAQSIATSVFGLVVILQTLTTFTLVFHSNFSAPGQQLVFVISHLVRLGIGAFLVLGRRKLARFARRLQTAGLGGPRGSARAVRASHFQAVAFSVVGLVFVVNGLVALIYAPQNQLIFSEGGSLLSELQWTLLPILRAVAQIALGSLVFFKSGRLAAFWASLDSGASGPRPDSGPPQQPLRKEASPGTE